MPLSGIGSLSWQDSRLLVESVADYAIFMLDPEGYVSTWNLGAEKIKGYRPEEIVGQHFSKFYTAEDIAARKPERELEIARAHTRVEDEGWRLRKDGSRFWANVVITAVRDESGTLRGFAKVTRDLTQRRAAEEQLRQAEQRFHHLVDAISDYAIFLLDASGHVATWNAGAERAKGYTADEIIGRHFSAFYTAEDRAAGRPARILDTVVREGRFEEEGWRVRKDGTRFWANVTLTPLRDEHAQLVGFAKVTRDLTSRRKGEEELRRSEERFRLLVEGVQDYGIYMLDEAGRVTTWNTGAQNIKGFTAQEIIGRHFSAFFTPEDVAAGRPQRELEIALTSGRFEEEGWRVRKDGTRFWASVVVAALRDSHGEMLGFAKVTRDLTSRRKAEETERELVRAHAARATAEAAELMLSDERERYRALSQRLEIILEGVADGITVQDRAGAVMFANTAAARFFGVPTREELLTRDDEVMRGFDLLDEHGAPIPPEDVPARRVFAGEPSATATIRVRQRSSGRQWWSAVRATGVIGSDGQPELAITVWHDVTDARRREEHDRYLARASGALNVSLEYESMLATLAGLLVPGLADWCSIHVREGETLQCVAVAHADPAKTAAAKQYHDEYPPDAQQARGIWNVLRTGHSELYEELSPDLLAEGARDPEHLAYLRTLGLKSLMLVPIRTHDHVFGVLALVSAEGARRYDEHDLALAEELARRAGTGIENARLYRAEKRARERLELLAHAGESFSGALAYEDVLQSVVHIALPTLGDFAFFDVVEGPAVRRVASAYEDPEIDALIKETSWARSERTDKNLCALSTGRTGFHPRIDDAWRQDTAGSPEDLDLLRRLELGSMITVPLRARGDVLGALTLCFGKSGRYHTADDVQLAEELARRAGAAVLQARLHEEARASARRAEQAAKRAEEASRMKDEFLATVSHELRTPLNAIVGWSALLSDRNLDAGLTKGLDVIQRNAQAQAKIIEDILDVSRIITGKLRLDLRSADLVAIVQDAIEVVRPSANAKGISISLTAAPSAPVVVDTVRIQQVVWNLLSNAVKFTDARGSVAIEVHQDASEVRISATDTGRGIEPGFLPYVFDRFQQADGSSTRAVGGLGLGLAIVRHIVELHGGRVSAASAGAGKGATFEITLPVHPIVPAVSEPEIQAARPGHDSIAPRPGALAGLRVLVVDDEADARDLLQTVLAGVGAVVETAGSAREGLALVQRFKPQILVSDIGMPETDGYSFMERIRSGDSGRHIPSIALTAYTRDQDRAKALAAGFTTHIGKPVTPHDLIAAVVNLAVFASS